MIKMKKYDLIIIGGGPAGVTAAVCAKRGGLSALTVEKTAIGGAAALTDKIENFPPFLSISGYDLAQKFSEYKSGCETVLREVTEIKEKSDGFSVMTDNESYTAKAVILAGGVRRKRLIAENEEKFAGKGVSYCALCDGAFFKGKKVAVAGGGNTALSEAIYLSEICEKVYLIHRRNEFRAQKYLTEKAKLCPNIEIIKPNEIKSIWGDKRVEGIALTDREISLDGVFAAIGTEPQSDILKGFVDLSKDGFVIANEECKTSRKGVFCAGDLRQKAVRQIVTAVSDGAVAAYFAEQYIHGI